MGNICRSPLAEGVVRCLADRAKIGAFVEVDSAGTLAYHAGEQPDPRARKVAASRGYDLSKMRARRVAEDDFSHGCEGCRWEVETEGRDGSYPQTFEARALHLTADPASAAWPRSMELNLSNSCNLQCIQCNQRFAPIAANNRFHPYLLQHRHDEFLVYRMILCHQHASFEKMWGSRTLLAGKSAVFQHARIGALFAQDNFKPEARS